MSNKSDFFDIFSCDMSSWATCLPQYKGTPVLAGRASARRCYLRGGEGIVAHFVVNTKALRQDGSVMRSDKHILAEHVHDWPILGHIA